MKYYSEEELRKAFPSDNNPDFLHFCLKQLFKDKKHTLDEEVVKALTFEELIGGLLAGEQYIKDVEHYEADYNEAVCDANYQMELVEALDEAFAKAAPGEHAAFWESCNENNSNE